MTKDINVAEKPAKTMNVKGVKHFICPNCGTDFIRNNRCPECGQLMKYTTISHEVLPKRIDLLDASDPECRFRINIDALNECFGANLKMQMKACYPLGKKSTIPGVDGKDEFFVWMPKMYSNSSEWINTISDDDSLITEVGEAVKEIDWKDENKHLVDGLRIVFVKKTPSSWYEFKGVFATERMDHLNHSYRRIATKVKLIGNPVTAIQLIDDNRNSD